MDKSARKREILLVNPAEARHGSTYRARGLFSLLQALGHNVCYVESNYNGVKEKNMISIRQRDSLWGLLAASLRRGVLCWQQQYDLLYLQKAWLLNLPCLLMAKWQGKKVIIDMDDLDSEWQPTLMRRKLTQWSERWLPKYADAITTHNRYLGDYVAHFISPSKIFLVPQGVDTGLFDPQRFDKLAEKERLGLGGRIVCCFLGSFTFGSALNLEEILTAFHYAYQRDKRLFFLFIGGEGLLEADFRQLVAKLKLEDVVLISGRKPQREVPHYLAAADIGLIYMSDNKANQMRVSLKLLEYLAMELQVVGRVVGSSRDTLGESCFLVDASPKAVGEKIVAVARGGLRKDSARPFIKANYDWRIIASQLEATIRSVAA